jgi:hypothetical protein
MKREVCWLAVAVLLVLSVASRPQAALSEGVVTLRFDPTFAQVRPGETVRLEIWIDEVTDMDQLSFDAAYDSAVFVPLDADPGRAGVQLETGPLFLGGCTMENEATGGVIRFDAFRAPEAGPFSGTGVAAVAVFQVREDAVPGVYPVRFDATSIAVVDDLGHLAPTVEAVDATVRVPPVTTAMEGWITREGRSDHARTSVSAFFYTSESLPPLNWAQTCTDEHGDFWMTVPQQEGVVPAGVALPSVTAPPGPYEWAYVRLSFPNYNSECYWELLDDEVVDIGWHTLEGGDVNGDGCINIYDVVRVIHDFGESVPAPCFVPFEPCAGPLDPVAPASDINGDCRVNIFDLSITGENFGLCTNCH